jgi:hypothetical protein
MSPRFAKVSEIAEKYRVSADAVYLWIRQGKIPADCVIRIAGTVRIDELEFEQQLRSGALYHVRGRKRCGAEVANRAIPPIAEDNFTTTQTGLNTEHRWTSETGSVGGDHPYSPEMRTLQR